MGIYRTSLKFESTEHCPLVGWDVIERTIKFDPVSFSRTAIKASTVPDWREMVSSTAKIVGWCDVGVGFGEIVG